MVAGDCVMYGFCDNRTGISPECNVNIPPQPMIGYDVRTLCPEFDPSLGVCCDQTQFQGLVTRLAPAATVFGKCPACLHNFRMYWCEYTCAPDQASFVKVLETDTGLAGPVANHTLYNVTNAWGQKLWILVRM